MSDVCREFGISRKTGYKIYNRYKECGIKAMTEDAVWLFTFMDYDLGYFDIESRRLEPLAILLAQDCYLCLRVLHL